MGYIPTRFAKAGFAVRQNALTRRTQAPPVLGDPRSGFSGGTGLALIRSLAVLPCFAMMMAAQALAPASAAPQLLDGQFVGQALSIEAEGLIGPLSVGLGTSASVSCPCAGTNGHTEKRAVSTVEIGPLGTILLAKITHASAYGLKTATTANTKQSSNVAGLNLLGGLIKADLIQAVASMDATAATFTPSDTGTSFKNLVIAGQKIDISVPENTVIPLAGLGSVTVKFVNTEIYGTLAAGIEVEGLRIEVNTPNSLGIAPGTVIVVGEALAGFNRTQPTATLGGFAETLGVTAQAGTLLQEAAAAGAVTGIGSCSGTNGATLTDTVATVSATGLLSLNAATVTAFGGPSGSATVAQTTSTISNLSLLGGLITADTIVAAASESRTGKVSTGSTAGSMFGNLSVLGVPVATNVPANTVIDLPALGYVVINEQPAMPAGHIQVNGLHVVITLANSLGLPVGAEIFLAHADATATAF